MMNSVIFSVVLALIPGIAAAQSVGCLAATHAHPIHHREWFAGIVTGTDATAIKGRAVFGLSALPDSAVVIVTDSTTCALAAEKLVQALGAPTVLQPVWVVRIGPDRFWVSDGRRRTGERYTSVLFDNAYQVITVLVTS